MMPQPFPNPSTYAGHSGVDYGVPGETPIRASGPGRVSFAGWLNDRAGYSAIVDYDGGPRVLYCHQPRNPRNAGLSVDLGTWLGVVGTTGHSTGNHLHMEIMEGAGAHTHDGVWNYFDRSDWIGKPAPTGSGSNSSTPVEGRNPMAALAVGTVVNVVPEYGTPPENGTLWIASADGSFKVYPPEYDPNIRGILTVVSGLGTGDEDKIPTLSSDDASALFRVWRIAVTGK